MLGKALIVIGVVLFFVGLIVYAGPSLPLLGRLPGDIRIERPGFRFYFPLTTCLVLSALISSVLYILSKFR